MPAYWTTLSHNGVSFPDLYQPEGFPVRVLGKPVKLSPLAEEMAYNLAKKKETPYIKDQVFTNNFMSDFVKQLPEWAASAKFADIDFTELFRKVDREKAAKETMTKEEKKLLAAERKQRREELKAKFGFATLDGKQVEFANYLVEPPGLFMGRGQHPMRGKWKPRVNQRDVILNLDEGTKVPGDWKGVVHDHNSMWMAKWIDKLTGNEKYVWLHESSHIQQSRSKAKYDNAAKVGVNLKKIESAIERELLSKDQKRRQIATVCYLIHVLGMRVGDEKDEDEADTVGASTLRVEHVKFKSDTVEFNFLGKDSVPWNKEDRPPQDVFRNLQAFVKGKKPDVEIFHDVTSSDINQFLSSVVPGVTAKVFRTYHATAKTATALRNEDVRNWDDLDKLYFAKEANLQAAVFCNHQRTPPKTWDQSFEKRKQKLEEAKAKEKRNDKRVRKLEKELDFYIRTKSYNLNTSLKNYIDPRVYKAWCDYVGLDWARLYSKSLQRKFSWVAQSGKRWEPQEKSEQVLAKSGPGAKGPP
ncbi:MAG: DNA topoisomerase I [Nitrososphaerales archaeon]|nr:DNA topoisomerase I [Nitrososphaerales archaeon]